MKINKKNNIRIYNPRSQIGRPHLISK